MGQWLARYGESIYGTRGGPYLPVKQITSTRRGNTVYVHVFEWKSDPLVLPRLPAKIARASLLTGGSVRINEVGETWEVTVPPQDRREIDTIIKLELASPALALAPVHLSPPALVVKTATASNVYKSEYGFRAAQAVDGDGHSRWATDAGTKQAWLEVELAQPSDLGRLYLDEAYPGRVKKFELQCWTNGQWQTLLQGTGIGTDFTRNLPTVRTQKLRLNILESTDGPTLNEFQVFAPGK
jgi:alpha-L-fucosidase